MERLTWPDKYVDESFTGGVDWSLRIPPGSVISDKSFTVVSGSVTLSNEGISTVYTTVLVSGGVPGRIEVLCSATLDTGEVLEEIAELRIYASS